MLRGEAVLLEQVLQRGGRAEGTHADAASGGADVPGPAERGGLFHRDPRRHFRRQHAIAVLLRPVVSQFPTRQPHPPLIDTRRPMIPCASSRPCASSPRATSLPLPSNKTCGFPSAVSART